MKRSEAFPSSFLGKDDVPRPFIATIQDVVITEIKGENGMEKKPVMHFAGGATKPLIVNNINWIQCEVEYGPDSDGWTGKPIEIFVDPNVMFGAKRVGGVRLRIPANSPANSPARNTGGADPAIVQLLTSASKSGSNSLRSAWELLTNTQKLAVKPIMPALKSDALAKDMQGDAFEGGPEPEHEEPTVDF